MLSFPPRFCLKNCFVSFVLKQIFFSFFNFLCFSLFNFDLKVRDCGIASIMCVINLTLQLFTEKKKKTQEKE